MYCNTVTDTGSKNNVKHTFTTYVSNGDATCAVDGTKTATCNICNTAKDTVTDLGSKNNVKHTFTNYISNGDATCAVDGTKTATCDVCNTAKDTVTDLGSKDKIEHSFDNGKITLEPDCTTDGTKTFTCLICGNTKTEEVSATGHNSGSVVIENTIDATCTSTGSYDKVIYCTVCTKELSREKVTVEKLDHYYTSSVTAPTCTAKGYTTYTCSACSDTYKDNITAALGHNMSEYVVTEKPGCTENGKEVSQCSRCDYSSEHTLYATGHEYHDGVCVNCGDDMTDDCSCMCHKNGFMGFIWKIIRFFCKIFGANKVCECGLAHY